jgi:alkylhydroperoxidase family enzyme
MSWIAHPESPLPGVLAVQTGTPELLRTHLAFYRHVMFGPSGLARRERELVATAVSVLNRCFY